MEIKVYPQRKEYEYFSENKKHYCRALGMKIVLQNLENTPKQGFCTYEGNNLLWEKLEKINLEEKITEQRNKTTIKYLTEHIAKIK